MNIKTNNYSSPALRIHSCRAARRIICTSPSFSGTTTPVEQEIDPNSFSGETSEVVE